MAFETRIHLAEQWKRASIFSDSVIDAFLAVNREKFLLDDYKEFAYEDRALPIMNEQTISQPYTCCYMIDLLELESSDVVLEIGCGSGYNAALLSKLCKKVYSLEIDEELYKFALDNLSSDRVKNVKVLYKDGSSGYLEHAPYDGIILSAAVSKVPKVILEQLKDGGVLVAPVGDSFGQKIVRIRRYKDSFHTEEFGEFSFVPMKNV